jgi:glycerol-3-phosphate dehydrogenase
MPSTSSSGPTTVDVLVVGGGINGAGIARDLAGRGLSVLLCEQHDLAQHTSSASTKLIHGGLRYLEHGEFGLVRKALAERERLLRSAPHIMRPLRFVMPHDPLMRPAWLIRLGLFLYDHLARREWLPASGQIDLSKHPAGEPLQPRLRRAFTYADAWVDDARLVLLNAIDAAERGAQVETRCACTQAVGGSGAWTVHLQPDLGTQRTVQARALVNATGPWASLFMQQQLGLPPARPLRLVKGSHIVVPRLFDHGDAYLFQNADQRIIFAIPYEGEFTLIGTTDVEHGGPIGQAQIEADEVRYLCDQASRYFARPVQPSDVVWSFSGVRPLLDDAAGQAAEITRDYRIELDTDHGAPLLQVWGGKLTTYRRLAEDAADVLCAALRHGGRAWTANALLPGGDLSAAIGPPRRPDVDIARFEQALRAAHADRPALPWARWARAYGSRVEQLLQQPGLDAWVVPGVCEAELRHMAVNEWARSADDALWRRSKLGLHLDAVQRAAVAAWWERSALAARQSPRR